MAKLYETIDELVKRVKNSSDYCFDKKWLEWLEQVGLLEQHFKEIHDGLYGEKGVRDSVAIACAAMEIAEQLGPHGDKEIKLEFKKSFERVRKCSYGVSLHNATSYGADSGDVQKSLYAKLFSSGAEAQGCHDCGGDCELYSRDVMTNYGYAFKRAITVLEGRKISPEFALKGNACSFGNKTFFSVGYGSVYHAAIEGIPNDLSRALQDELRIFASRSSTLGNYCCVPKAMAERSSLNQAKGDVCSKEDQLFVSNSEKTAAYRVNDQFALFLEWLKKNATRQKEKELIGSWKREMLFTDQVCGYYLDAAQAYKASFEASTLEGRLDQFLAYLKSVNRAIEFRSKLIVEKVEEAQKNKQGAQ